MELLNSAVIAAVISGVVTLIGLYVNNRWQRRQFELQTRRHEELLDLEFQKFSEESAKELGGAVVATEIPGLIEEMFDGRNARSFGRIADRIKGIDHDALRKVMIGMKMESYTGPQSGIEYWRFRDR